MSQIDSVLELYVCYIKPYARVLEYFPGLGELLWLPGDNLQSAKICK